MTIIIPISTLDVLKIFVTLLVSKEEIGIGSFSFIENGNVNMESVLDISVYDEVIPVTTAEAYAWGRAMGRQEGILVGITAGAAIHTAVELAKRPENAGKTIVALLPDTGERYLSTPGFLGE